MKLTFIEWGMLMVEPGYDLIIMGSNPTLTPIFMTPL